MNPINKLLLLKNVGSNIKKLRKEKNIEVKEFAFMLKVTPQAIGKIENGLVDLNLSRIIEISHSLEVSIIEILEIKNDPILDNHFCNNSAGYYVKTDVININEDDAKLNFLIEFKNIANNLVSKIKSK